MIFNGFDGQKYSFINNNGEEYLQRIENFGHAIFTTILFEDLSSAGHIDVVLRMKYGDYEFTLKQGY